MKIQARIRFADPKDIDAIIQLCQAHAHFEKAEYNPEGKAKLLAQGIFSEQPKLYCLVVESDGVLIGYATYMKQYATWDAEQYVYMDCLYLKEFARGLGIGEKLMRRIQSESQKLGCSHIQWQTPDFNVRAIKFYNRIGAHAKPKERFFLTC